jgi:uncharacterized protein (TIGR02217 family)
MSQTVYPALPGLAWPMGKTPVWKTTIKPTASGREFRTSLMSYPRYRFTLQYEFLRDGAAFNEYQQLFGLFDKMGGAYDTFLFSDPNDNAVGGQLIGTGNGSTTAFQLVRTLGGASVPVFDVNGAPQIFKAGALQTVGSNYTLSATGLVTFTVAPTSGQAITWSGSYYWRCRFEADEMTFDEFMATFWSTGRVNLITVKP